MNYSVVNLVYAFDNNYAKYAAVSALSAIMGTKQPIALFLIYSQDAGATAEMYTRKLRRAARRVGANLSVFQHAIKGDQFDAFVHGEAFKYAPHLASAAYFRLLIPELIPVSRAIYLDADTLVLGDIAELFATELDGKGLAAAPVHNGAVQSTMPYSSNNIYINSGVMLLDVDKMRRDEFFKSAMAVYHMYSSSVTFADQCVINKVYEERKMILQSYWNTQVYTKRSDIDSLNKILSASAVKILHFVGPVKPWMGACDIGIREFWQRFEEPLHSP